MEPEGPPETEDHARFCPECGIEEPGFFCRKCGTLLRGEDGVLCPRCRHVVEPGGFCNQCGQELAGLALSLKQLDMAGGTFWVTGGDSSPEVALEPAVVPPDASVTLAGAELPGWLHQSSSETLADAELPDWLRQFPNDAPPPELESHVIPSLEPLGARNSGNARSRFLTIAILLMGLLLLGMLVIAALAMLKAGG